MSQVYDVAGMRHDAPSEQPYRVDMAQTRDTGTPTGHRFAVLIRAARQGKGLSQAALGEESGVERQTIIRYESGKTRNPDPEALRAVCAVLEVDVREALVALGYLTREEISLTAPPTSEDEQIRQVIAILQDPQVPSAEKASWVDYLKYLHERASNSNTRERAS